MLCKGYSFITICYISDYAILLARDNILCTLIVFSQLKWFFCIVLHFTSPFVLRLPGVGQHLCSLHIMLLAFSLPAPLLGLTVND